MYFLVFALLVNSLIAEDHTVLDTHPFPPATEVCRREFMKTILLSFALGGDPCEKGFVWFISVYSVPAQCLPQ